MTKSKSLGAALFLVASIGAHSSASATAWWELNTEHMQASAQGCQMGIPQGCQLHQQQQIARQAYEDLYHRCNAQEQAACNKMQKLEVEANEIYRQRIANRARTTPSSTIGGGQTPGEIYSDILDINHNGFQNRGNISTGSQTNAVNGIWGRQVVTNPNTGNSFTAEGYSDQYWRNDNGQYFGSDDPNFDPNLQPEFYGGGNWNSFYSQ